MSSNHSRILALTTAMFLAAVTAAIASPVKNISAHGAQPQSHGFMASQAHGMMASQKHNFVSAHHFTGRKAGAHGFASTTTNRRKH